MTRRITFVALGGLRRGAVATLARRDALFAAEAGWNVTFVALAGREEPVHFPAGVRLVRVAGPLTAAAHRVRRRSPGAARLLDVLAAVPAVRAATRRDDVVVSHGGLEAALAASSGGRARTVFRMHNFQAALAGTARSYRRGERWLFRAADARAVRRSTEVVAVSATLADQVARVTGRRPAVRINGIPERAVTSSAERDIAVLYVGRLVREKGVDLLPALVGDLPSDQPVVIAGQGVLRGELEREFAGDHGVEFVGEVPPAVVANLMGRAELVVVPSRDEPYGMVVVEALAAGACVLASRVGGIPEIMADGEGGRLLPVGDVPAWRSEIRRLLEDPEQRQDLVRRADRTAERHAERTTLPALHEVYAG